jgi:ABC-2 type transport system permease protein
LLALIALIFGDGIPARLPIVVVDADGSALSRHLIRSLDAAQSLAVSDLAPDRDEAIAAIRRGTAYAAVVIPRDFERDLSTGRHATVIAYTNAQMATAGGSVTRALRMTLATLSAGITVRQAQMKGMIPRQALAAAVPIRAGLVTLFNPRVDYGQFLGATLWPALLTIFAMAAGAMTVGRELRNRTADTLLQIDPERVLAAIAGKLAVTIVPLAILAAAAALAFGSRIFSAVPVGTNVLVAGASVLLTIVAVLCGAALVALCANLRLALSLVGVVASPAFAYAGITFPAMAMPDAARIWRALLPPTHLMTLQIEQWAMGMPLAASLPQLAALGGFGVLATLALLRLPRLLADPAAWGRQ